ncbi:unnamed protein product, partial [Mesorhabditis belari]|uniref:EndoU domain-containing protein n=1 Tax=Mesorhabditis belari TaxID=2138241 RepID=A0AAF3EAM0_9BILA
MELRFSSVLVLVLVIQSCGARPQTSDNLDVDVKSVLTSIFSTDENRATNAQVVLNFQNMASKKNPDHDNAQNPLFTTVDSALLNRVTYSAFQSLVATFTTPSVDVDDPMTDNGIVSDVSTFIQQLNKIWFTPFRQEFGCGKFRLRIILCRRDSRKQCDSGEQLAGLLLQGKRLRF